MPATTGATISRIVVASGLMLVSYATLQGSAPSWPDELVYSAATMLTAALWVATAIDPSRWLVPVADAALLAVAAIRGLGYLLDLSRTADPTLLTPVGVWLVVIALAARPLRPFHRSPSRCDY